MAMGARFVCTHCTRAVEAWSDGNPYYLDEQGNKHYAYHPDHENLARCIGNDTPHLCLSCGSEAMVDSRDPKEDCPSCGAADLVPTWHLERRLCPYCEVGKFSRDTDFNPVS